MTTRTSADANSADGGPTRSWRLFLVCFAMLIVSLDQYIVVVALPDIGRALGYTAQTLQLVVSAYAVASSGFLLVGGRAADLLGRRRMLATGLVLYTVASLAGGLATGPPHSSPPESSRGWAAHWSSPRPWRSSRRPTRRARRNRALGIWGAAGAAGLVVGVLLGGVLTRYLGWSSVFFINVPLAVGALVLTFVVVPQDPPRDRTRRFDLAGALTAMAAVTLVVWSLVHGPQLGWTAAGSARPGGPRAGPRLGVHQDRAASPRPADAPCPGPQPVRPPGSRALLPVHGHLRVAAVLRVDLSAERSAVRRAPDRPRVRRPHLRRRRGVSARRGGLHPDRPAHDMSGRARRRCIRRRSPRRQPHRHRRLPRAPAGTSPGQHR